MNSRKKNTKRNMITGLIYRFITIVFPFIIRTIIIYVLGEKYLGLTSLFTSILQVLNMAEMGFSTAIIFQMYKPIADDNIKEVNKLLNYYKKIYRTIGFIILAIGIVILPFISYFINGDVPSNINIYYLYILYLLDSVVSYFLFAYKSSLLNAVQRLDIVNIIQSLTVVIKYTLQIIAVTVFKNFYTFVVISIVLNCINNLIIGFVSKIKYSQYYCDGEISKKEKKNIKNQVVGLLIGKLSDTSRNSFDSIIISTFLGLTTVAIYNNYYYIFNAVYLIILVITSSMQSSIGNSIAIESVKKNYNDFLKFQYLFMIITNFCCTSLITMYQPFMKLWVGDKLLLNETSMILFVLYFYLLNINNVKNLYFTGNGLWWKSKKAFIFEAVSNLILNFVLGYLFGINGVIVATILTILIYNFIWRTNILFDSYFKISSKEFYLKTFYYSIIVFFSCTVSYLSSNLFSLNFILRIIQCIFLPNILFILFTFKSSEFNLSIKFALDLVKKNELKKDGEGNA